MVQRPFALRLCAKAANRLTLADAYDSVRKAAQAGPRRLGHVRDEARPNNTSANARLGPHLGFAADEHGETLFARRGSPSHRQTLTFASRPDLALSSNPTYRPASGHVKLDEFALHRDQRNLYASPSRHPMGRHTSIISTIAASHRLQQVINDIKQAVTR